ncbi:MAG: hypothetical protein V7642_371 [Burkholderiales bacterium]|jgi:hypothetical protein
MLFIVGLALFTTCLTLWLRLAEGLRRVPSSNDDFIFV